VFSLVVVVVELSALLLMIAGGLWRSDSRQRAKFRDTVNRRRAVFAMGFGKGCVGH
jgi:hypothetical protein